MDIVIDVDFSLTHLRRFIPSFNDLQASESNLLRMTGITNQTFLFSHTNSSIEPQKVIFRVFGKTCEGTFINRSDETIVYAAVGDAGLGPKMIGYDSFVRAEEFLESRVLLPTEMNQLLPRRKVALALADFHGIQVPELASKDIMVKNFLNDSSLYAAVEEKLNKRGLFTQRENTLIDEIRKVFLNKDEHNSLLALLPSSESAIAQQVKFGHNDLLANNILVLNSDSSIRFIDFEYSHYNIRAFDIANYFNEAMYDYSVDTSPFFGESKEVIQESDYYDFILYYVVGMHLKAKNISFDVEKLIADERYYAEITKRVGLEAIEEEAKRILNEELQLAICLSHLYWGVWSLHMSKDPNIQFDYVEFSYVRFRKYKETKQALMAKKSSQP